MFKKEDDSFFSYVNTIQRIVIFLIIASVIAGIFMFFFVEIISGILLAVILPVILIVLSMMFNAICYIAIDAKLARNKTYGEDDKDLLEYLQSGSKKDEKPNTNQNCTDSTVSSDEDKTDKEQ